MNKYDLNKSDLEPKKESLLKHVVLTIGGLALTAFIGSKLTPDTQVVYPPVVTPHEVYVLDANPKLSVPEARTIVYSVYKWSQEFALDPKLVLAVTKVESSFDKHAISAHGALGLMQVVPKWHTNKLIEARQELGSPEIFNIDTNVYLGTRILRECSMRTVNLNKALQCYSGGALGYDKKVLAEYNKI